MAKTEFTYEKIVLEFLQNLMNKYGFKGMARLIHHIKPEHQKILYDYFWDEDNNGQLKYVMHIAHDVRILLTKDTKTPKVLTDQDLSYYQTLKLESCWN